MEARAEKTLNNRRGAATILVVGLAVFSIVMTFYMMDEYGITQENRGFLDKLAVEKLKAAVAPIKDEMQRNRDEILMIQNISRLSAHALLDRQTLAKSIDSVQRLPHLLKRQSKLMRDLYIEVYWWNMTTPLEKVDFTRNQMDLVEYLGLRNGAVKDFIDGELAWADSTLKILNFVKENQDALREQDGGIVFPTNEMQRTYSKELSRRSGLESDVSISAAKIDSWTKKREALPF